MSKYTLLDLIIDVGTFFDWSKTPEEIDYFFEIEKSGHKEITPQQKIKPTKEQNNKKNDRRQ